MSIVNKKNSICSNFVNYFPIGAQMKKPHVLVHAQQDFIEVNTH